MTGVFIGYLVIAGFAMRAMCAWRDDVRMWSIDTADQVPAWAVFVIPLLWPPLLVAIIVLRLASLVIDAPKRR